MSDSAQNSPEQLGSVVAGFLAGDPQARESLPRDYGKNLIKIASGTAPDLKARGLAEDVVQEMFQLLLTRPCGHYDPGRGSAWAYLRTMIRLAARDVRAKEALAGAPRRPPREENSEFDVGSPLAFDDALVTDCKAADPDCDALDGIGVVALIEAIPAGAPWWLPMGLSLVAEGLTVTEAASALRISRFAFRRALNRWAAPHAESLR